MEGWRRREKVARKSHSLDTRGLEQTQLRLYTETHAYTHRHMLIHTDTCLYTRTNSYTLVPGERRGEEEGTRHDENKGDEVALRDHSKASNEGRRKQVSDKNN